MTTVGPSLVLDSSHDSMLFFDSMKPADHPLVRHESFIRNLNALLDMAARELPGWQGAQAGERRLVTPFNAMPQQSNGCDCGVFTMLVVTQHGQGQALRERKGDERASGQNVDAVSRGGGKERDSSEDRTQTGGQR